MSAEKTHLLIIDDDARLRSLLYKFLTENNFHVTTADTALEALKLLELFDYNLAVVDVMMPEMSGFELTQCIRSTNELKECPILLLTAMDEVDNRIEGLKHGADDYLTKPFDPRELLLRIHAILRRSQQDRSKNTLKMGDVLYKSKTHTLERLGKPISLTSVENTLLKLFAQRSGKVVTREDLADVLGPNTNPRTIDVQVTRLRRKIEENPRLPRFLQTVRGQGYTLVPEQ